MHGPISIRTVAVGLFASVCITSSLFAQPVKPLDPTETRRVVADQEAAVQVRDAITFAEKLARSHPEKAVLDLKRARFALATRTDVSSAKQTELLGQLDAAIKSTNQAGAKPQFAIDPRLILKNEQNRKAIDAAQTEARDVQEAINAISRDEADGRLTDARARVSQLAKKYPSNPAVIQLSHIGMTRNNVSEAKYLSEEMGRRFLVAMNNVDKSAMPLTNDMEFPKDWIEITKRREKLNRVQLGEEEQALLQALEKQITTPAKGQPFEEVIQTLSNAIGKNIYIDKQSFDNLGLDMRKPVDMPANVTARTALRGMLQSLGMTFVIRDKVIKVVSIEEARKNMMTRSYEIRDLVQTGGPFNGGATWGPYIDFLQTQKNAEQLMESIMMSVDPNAWSNRGGPSSIVFHYPSMSIVVRAPSEVHYTLGLAMYGDGKKKK